MKKTLLYIIVLFMTHNIYGQKGFFKSRLKWHSAIVVNYIPITIDGPINQNDIEISGFSNTEGYPVWERQKKQASALAFTGGGGLYLPVYNFSKKLSLGVNHNIGVGFFLNIKDAKGVDYYMLDFPQYIELQHKNPDKIVNYAFGIGYKYCYTSIPYSMPLASATLFLDDLYIKLHASLMAYKLYTNYTSEGIEPTITMREFGIEIGVLK